MYTIQNFSYTIDRKVLLQDVDLTINTNKFLAIVGINGCGKSTLFKAINRNAENYTGTIILDDTEVQRYDLLELAQKRSVLNQSFAMPYSFLAKDIIEMGFFPYRLGLKEKNMILEYIIDRLDIAPLVTKDYTILSGGEKQKIQLARVVTQIYASSETDKFLFLDEPTLNLDIYFQYKLLDLIRELITELQIGVCAVLHDLGQAYLYADEVAMIKDNTIKYLGVTKEILTPNNILDVFGVRSEFVYSQQFKREVLINGI